MEGLALAAGLSREAAHSQLASALDVVLYVGRTEGLRHLREIGVFVRRADGLVEVVPGVRFTAAGELVEGPAVNQLIALIR